LQVTDFYYFLREIPRSKSIRFVYAILFSFFVLAQGCRDTRSESPCDTGSCVLVIGTSGDYVPFSHWPETQIEPDGFSISVAEAYARDRGATLEWVRFRWPDLVSDLEAKRFDVALSGVTVRPERAIRGRFSLPLATSGAVVLVRADSAIQSESGLDQSTVRIAVNAGGHLERVARRLFPAAQIESIPDNTGVLDRLTTGAADAVVTDRIEAPHWQQQTSTRLRAIGPLTRDAKAAWFRPDREAEVIEFDRWLLAAEESGLLDELRSRYALPRDFTARATSALLSRLNERLSLIPAVADAKIILGKPVEDRAREERVLNAAKRDVERTAAEMGVPTPDMNAVERLFRAQIEAAKWIQEERVGRARAAGSHTKVDENARERARIDLNEAIRPALLFLGDRISMLIVTSASETSEPLAYEDVAVALEDQGLPETHLRALHEALGDIIGLAGPGVPGTPLQSAGQDKVPNE
jgi:cyclohexadienyl dehydratase